MITSEEFVYERVDDIPLLLALMIKMQMPIIFDKHLGNHGHQKGLTNGWVGAIWLAYILSQGRHTKVHVQEWVMNRHKLLQELTGETIRAEDFTDDSLGLLLKRLSDEDIWPRIEDELWQCSLVIHQVKIEGVRLDSTTSYGYHEISDDGIMQHGHSKDKRPDLAQLKLMLAVAEPSGVPIASDVLAGERADDPLYVPLIKRVRQILWGKRGLLYTGDSKMAALATRADIVAHHDYYLTVLPQTGETAQQWDEWLGAIIDGCQTATLIWRDGQLLGGGYEFSRTLTLFDEEKALPVSWTERVQLVRSRQQAQRAIALLEKHLQQAETALYQLTPPPARGRRQYDTEEALQTAIDHLLAEYQVAGLLTVTWQREETHTTHYVGRGRGGPNRPTRTDVKVRYVINTLQRNEPAITQQRRRFGWRAYVTNLPQERWSLTDTVCHYRAGYCVERDFHLIKDRPLGLSPLYVQRDDQIIGLTHLLTIGLRLLTLIEAKTRDTLQQTQATLIGLYEGQPNRATERPTGLRLLRAFSRAEVSRVGIQTPDGQWHWRLSPLSDLLIQILTLLGVSEHVYWQLGNSP